MRITKPQKLGLLTRCFENDGQAYLVLTAMAFFPFSAPRKLLHEVSLWTTAGQVLGRDAILDAAMSKQRGEVLIGGDACAAGGTPSTATSVRVQIGSVDKRLYVVGDRQWEANGPGKPTPFLQMPITWDRAFGGEGFARNPLGKGAQAIEVDGRRVHPLPNVEDPRRLVKSPGDKPEPVGFGPLDATWPQRMELTGTYDREWLETRFPGFAKDFQWEYFNVAPSDQRIDGFFRDDEAFRVEGMHPEHRVQEGKLPGVAARFFIVQSTPSGEDAFREASARIDTVYLLPTVERAVVIFRGMLPIAEDDGRDVKHVVAAFEDPAAPRSPEHYREALDKRLAEKTGPIQRLIDDDLLPGWEEPAEAVPEDGWNDMAAIVEREDLQAKYLERKLDRQIAAMREHFIANGVDAAEVDAKIPKRPEPPPKDLAKLPAYLERAEAEQERAIEDARARQRDAEVEARAQCAAMGVDFDALKKQNESGGPPKFSAEQELERMRDMVTLGKNGGAEVGELAARLEDPKFAAQLRQIEQQQLDAYRKFTHLMPAAPVSPEAGERLRAEVLAAHGRGESLARRDLTGAKLAGLDLSGIDLEEALLEGADLAGATLKGAKLTGATLARANLKDANLEGAALGRTNLGGAKLAGARLTGGVDAREVVLYDADLRGASLAGARLGGAQLMQAALTEVDLEGADLGGLLFFEADLSGAKLARTNLEQSTFIKCRLDRVDFSGASLVRTAFVECQSEGAILRGASMDKAVFAMKSSFVRADFRESVMKHSCFRGTHMPGADFSDVTADECDFSEAEISQGKLERLSAQRSLFVRTELRHADLRGANLMFAILQKTALHGADVRGANLFRADMAKVRGDKATRFDGAYLVEIRVVPEKNHPKVVP